MLENLIHIDIALLEFGMQTENPIPRTGPCCQFDGDGVGMCMK